MKRCSRHWRMLGQFLIGVNTAWRDDDNHVRPHSGLGGATPAEVAGNFAEQAGLGHAQAQIGHETTGLYS